MNTNTLDWKRIGIFITIAFGVAWLVALWIYSMGGPENTPNLLLVLAIGYMGTPALAHFLTRLITREGWHDLKLRPNFRRGWRYWLICWISPAIFTFAGMAIFFALFPQYFDPTFSAAQKLLDTAQAGGKSLPITPSQMVMIQTLTALLIAPILNAIPILGEEFGWRAYLLPKLMPLGGRKAMVWMGIIWGLWHAPLIAMGHNYGTDYPGAPWLGILATIWVMFIFGTFLGWATLRGGSVWPAVIGHGAINGIAAIYVFFTQGEPNLVLGPSVAGLIGSLVLAVVTLAIFFWPGAFDEKVKSVEPPRMGLVEQPQTIAH